MILDRTFRDGSLTLLPVDPDRDAPGLYEIFREQQMHTYTKNPNFRSVEDAADQLRAYIAHPAIWAWAVWDGEIFIGTFWLRIPEERDGKKVIADDAQRIGVPFWRQGYARRCRDLLYRFAFEELDVEEIHGAAWAENENSCTAMSRYGFTLERQSQSFNEQHGRVMTGSEYILTRERFRALHG